jgi:hypothetical protein
MRDSTREVVPQAGVPLGSEHCGCIRSLCARDKVNVRVKVSMLTFTRTILGSRAQIERKQPQ